ncbi:cytochrome C [Sulfurifustis variabilis]|uniref:Cytochrome C n=1 Tax=Sulfurifustis variabilis TaxID=1675686 RepID=A0A1B4V1W0_9GAMM|nr:cytochrome c1 [Sulfurifustis variabilis]BAU47255.1 cytochrome C [Sulfurifustis variabilis]
MRKLFCLLALLAAPAAVHAAAEHAHLDPVKVDLDDQPSLQRGARIFVNYCLSCHSAAYMRYNRMGNDLGISEELVKENLLFAADKVGDLMKAVMPKEDAKDWFGTPPPDLTLVARNRGPEWIYTYMRSFYRDAQSPNGWNNIVFANVAMPHVLYEWQGQQRPVFRTEKQTVHAEEDGKRVERVVERQVFDKFEIETPGTMSVAEYDRAMRDLTNFLVYLGEPAKLERYDIGVYVLIFLAVFLVFAYLLKKEYWKDVH